MLIVDIETIPNKAALQTPQWAAYKASARQMSRSTALPGLVIPLISHR